MYIKKDYTHLLGTPGFSDKALETHFFLYEGYVNSTNKILSELEGMVRAGQYDSVEFSELKRRLGWEFDGMRNHEYYFESMGGDGAADENGKAHKKISENFGSFSEWQKDFVATAKMRGIGWAALYEDVKSGRLINFWIGEHDQGHPAGANLLLNIDVFEHAYFPDYGKDRAGYIDAFMKTIKWDVVENRMM